MNIFCLHGHDNGSYVLPQCNGITRCDHCGHILNKWDLNFEKVNIKTTMDVSCTYDGFCIVTSKFKEICINDSFVGAEFIPIVNNYYIFMPKDIVLFDSEKRKSRFESHCIYCNNYRYIVGATPVFLLTNSIVLSNGFYRTDIEFGSDDSKSPLIICGEDVAIALRAYKLKKLDISKAIL